MTVRKIITDSDKLHRVAKQAILSAQIKIVARDLIDTATTHLPKYIGLGATQIGYNIRMFVMFDKSQRKFITIINPEIIRAVGKKKYLREGSLSLPGANILTGRYVKIRARYTDERGDLIERNFSNINARVFQHELDHLNGVLIDE
jgi:peptide deformylase